MLYIVLATMLMYLIHLMLPTLLIFRNNPDYSNVGNSNPSRTFISINLTSPEHTLCRVGGGGNAGAGGSGVASAGVGKRGQLGHGSRTDEQRLKMLIGGIGYRIRIVQVAAGYVHC